MTVDKVFINEEHDKKKDDIVNEMLHGENHSENHGKNHSRNHGEGYKRIWTVGHSNLDIAEFITMLVSFDIKVLADIRSLPGSRKYPQFNQEELAASLRTAGILYMHFQDLGGRRRPRADSANTAWRNKAFMGYADYMETDTFRAAVQKLEEIALSARVAYMCAEAVWWRCHRSLVSDYLKVHGWDVIHIMGKDKGMEHPFTSPARPVQGKLFYPGNE